MHLQDYIALHVRASGPSTFPSIDRYIRQQFPASVNTVDIARAINRMIKAGELELNDTGDAFSLPTEPETPIYFDD